MVTLVDAVLVSAPGVPDADRLVRIWSSATSSRETADVSYPEVLDLQARARAFDAIESASRTRVALTTDAGTERLRGESVTPGYFGLVGIQAAHGRLFTADEYAPDAGAVVVISHSLWQRRFGGRMDVLGQAFRTRPTGRQSAGSVRTIVGVMPAGFVGTVDPDVSDFWVPIAQYEPAAHLEDRLARGTWLLARLRPGVTLAQAASEVASIADTLAAEHPVAYDRITLVTEPFGESWRSRFRLSLYTLLAAAGLLLLIACTNIATLLVARLAQRENELRVRLALGATGQRLRRQFFAESLMIAIGGGAAGLALAVVAVGVFASSGVFVMPPYVQIAIEPPVVAVSFGLIVLTGLLFGVLPARLGSGVNVAAVAREHGFRVSLGRRQRRYGQVLVIAQVGLTFVLLAGAVLLSRTYQHLVNDDLGYRVNNLLRLAISPDPNVYTDPDARLALAADIKSRLDAYPGVVRSAVMAGVLPPWFDAVVDVTTGADRRWRDVGHHAVGPDFLEVMGMSVVGGRTFGPSDRATGATTALASASLARQLVASSGREAIGQSVRVSEAGRPGTRVVDIIGIVTDVVYHGPLRSRPADLDLYVPIERGGPGALSIAVETAVDPAALIEPLSLELGRLASTSPQHWISTMEGELALQYQDARLYAALSGIYGTVAVLLAVVGIYSVLANNVARRRHEFGIRLAVGASRSSIVRLVVGEGARTLAIGVAGGLGLALLFARLLTGLLHGVRPGDPTSLAVVAACLVLAGLAACAIPSLRAARVDPLETLRKG